MFVDSIEESPILALIDRIFEMRSRGETVLGLHIGEPDFDTPQGIRNAATRALEEGLTHYTSAQGLPELREAIAERLQRRHQIRSTASDVVVLPAKFAIYATLLVTAGVGDEVLLSNPTYLFDQPTRLVGATPKYFPLGPKFRLDVGALRKAITRKTRAIVLANPSNPTGQVLDRHEVSAVVDIAREHKIVLVSDETYESLVYGVPHVAAHAVAGSLDGVVTIGSFSKVFAMTGWRVGYAVAPPAIRERLVKVMEHTLTCLPPFIQRACAWGLAHCEPDAERFRDVFLERRDHLLEALESIRNLEVTRPAGAFYVFPRYNLPVSSVDFCRRLLEEEHLAVVPGVAFGSEGERHIRISYSRPMPELDDGVARLRRFLDRQPK
jgi:aspartate aminotransferase